jgi:sugar (pentulose or hexulose) kinase
MKRDILAIDVGTTAFKIGVFSPDLEKRCEASREYEINI